MDYYPARTEWDDLLRIMNYSFVVFFFLEAALKILALSFFGYFSRIFNRFDFLVVVASIVELAYFEISGADPDEGASVTAFRGFRLIRVMRLTWAPAPRAWPRGLRT